MYEISSSIIIKWHARNDKNKINTHSIQEFSFFIKQYYVSQYTTQCYVRGCYVCNNWFTHSPMYSTYLNISDYSTLIPHDAMAVRHTDAAANVMI